MGEAKRRKERLGEWYGTPVVPGHPDHVEPPKKPEYDPETAEVRMSSGVETERADDSTFFRRPAAGLALLGLVLTMGITASARDPNEI